MRFLRRILLLDRWIKILIHTSYCIRSTQLNTICFVSMEMRCGILGICSSFMRPAYLKKKKLAIQWWGPVHTSRFPYLCGEDGHIYLLYRLNEVYRRNARGGQDCPEENRLSISNSFSARSRLSRENFFSRERWGRRRIMNLRNVFHHLREKGPRNKLSG